MEIPRIEDVKGSWCRENNKTFKQRYPEFYDYLMENYGWVDGVGEKLYCYYNRLKEKPRCKVCGGEVEWRGIKRGWRDYCSVKCKGMCEELKEKTKKTNIEKWGVEVTSQSKEVKRKKRETCLKRYGADNPMKNEELKKKNRESHRKNWGEGIGWANKHCREKTEETCLKKYGVKHYTTFGKEETKEKIKKKKMENFLKKHPMVLRVEGDWVWCKCVDEKCNLCEEKIFKIEKSLFKSRTIYNNPLCPVKTPYRSCNTTYIEDFITGVLDKYGVKYVKHDRSVLDGKELDIWIEDKNIAIECNGCFFHNENHVGREYHREKWEKCKEKGIQLIIIWEDWIKWKREVVEEIVKAKVGVWDRVEDGRKCMVEEIGRREEGEFVERYHLQGRRGGEVRVGLKDRRGELLGVTVWGRKKEEGRWELLRFCMKGGVRVRGGVGKMMKYFIRHYDPKEIISYSMNDISDGGVYKKMGMEEISFSKSWWCIHQRTLVRRHRLFLSGKEKEEKEKEWWRIWDSGQRGWLWRKEEVNK